MFKLLILSMIFLFGCNNQNDPEEVLRTYVKYRFTSSQTKTGVLKYFRGKKYEEISNLSDGDFKILLDKSRYLFKSLKVLNKRCTEAQDKCFLTYLLKYSKKGDTQGDFLLEVKKIVEMTYIDSTWKIEDITELKTFIESKDEIRP